MATAPGTEFHEKLSDLTECAICAEILTNPKLLPCVHTFCLHCLEKYGKDKNPGDPMPCPICRNEFVIPSKGFSNFPNNFFIGKIVEITKLATVTAKDAVCDLCCDETAITKKFCIDCEQKLCDRCNLSHSRIKHCQNHQVVELGSQLNVKDLNFPSSYCEHHPKELIKMFCHEDNMAVCLICCVESHQSHRCSNVDKAAGEFIKQLKSDIEKVVSRRPEWEEAFHRLEKFKTEFVAEVSNTEEGIRQTGNKLKELIDQHTEMLVQNLRVVAEEDLKSFEITKQEIDRSRVMIDSYQRYCDELLARGSPVDICRAANQMHERAADLEQLPANCSVNDFYCHKVAFQPLNLDTRMKQDGVNNIVGVITVAKSTNQILKIQKSVSEIAVPANWDMMKNDEAFKRVQLNPNDQEYKDVARAVYFTAQYTVSQIVMIERIQNKILYEKYVARKAEMDAAKPEQQNERTLWHGTSSNNLESICLHGFDQSHCTRITAVHGGGVSFSKNFSYSAEHTLSQRDAKRVKHIFQCKVLTGDISSDGRKIRKYDSIVNNVANPTVFSIYSDNQAYPEYLIYFT